MDSDHKGLKRYFKVWADRRPFIAESKNSAAAPNYEWFVVTSQYCPETIWDGDQETIEAINRRFAVIQMTEKGV